MYTASGDPNHAVSQAHHILFCWFVVSCTQSYTFMNLNTAMFENLKLKNVNGGSGLILFIVLPVRFLAQSVTCSFLRALAIHNLKASIH